MKRFVIDASVLVKLFFEEAHSDAAARHVQAAKELLAPDLLWAECGNVVWKRLQRREISTADAAALLEEMRRVPVRTSASYDLVGDAPALAAETGRTVYDALYLALAVRKDVPLLTGDERLANALRDGRLKAVVQFVGSR